MERGLPGSRRGARGAGGGRSARGELRNLARRGRPPDLGHQRFRRSLDHAVYQRPDPPGHQRAAGQHGVRPQGRNRRHPERLSGRAGSGRPPVRAGGAPHFAAYDGDGAAARAGKVLGETACPGGSGRGAAGRRAEGDRPPDAGGRPALACGTSRGGPGEPGTAALRGAGRVARRIHRPRSQSPGAFGMRLGGDRRRDSAHSLRGDPGFRGALPRSVRAFSAPLDCAAAGAGLLAHRACRAAQGARRDAASAGHGLGDGQYPPGEHQGPGSGQRSEEAAARAGC